MNYLDQDAVRKMLEREFGMTLLNMLDSVACEMGDEMAYNLALEIRTRLKAWRTARIQLPVEAGEDGH